MRKLIKYVRPYWLAALLAPLLMMLEVAMDLMQPRFMASIIDEGVKTGNLGHIQQVGLWMVVTTLVGLIGGVGCTVFSSIASQRFGADVRGDLFERIQSFSFRKLEQFSTGSLITRLTNDITQVQNFVQMMLRVLVRAPLLTVGSFIMAFMINSRLALILLIVTPLLFAVLYIVIRKGFPLFSKVQARLDALNTVLQENLAGIRVVKAFVRADFEKERFGRANTDFMEMSLKANLVMATLSPVMFLLLNATIVAALWFGGNLIWSNSLQVGELVAFINYVTQVLFSLLMVAMMMMNVSRAKASADRIQEVLGTDPGIGNPESPDTTGISTGHISFDKVSFAYEGNETVLKELSFDVEPGQTVAILGATGAGKTSLVHLIPRLYEATSGTVRIDGKDVRSLDLTGLRSRIGMVLQQAILFSGTIKDNIAFGKPDASMEEIVAAAKAAQAHDFITKLPDGYDTLLGQRGVNLSGGQKQRISIARALLIEPAILILDDSTSAVDLGTESKIQKALKERMSRSTCLMIAQRITSVQEADRILVLEEGRIAASGTHKELMRSSALYREIYESQLGEEDAAHA
ncbi:ABC transporter ATP-binding protein [Paenibacillus sp. GD4]|uniref:ABC transporter ATP-binding protein n=1 Tax=Paenibacillus sp. GD4 TaxID=3068890 RepID=UPI002796CB20|nr:ABC transporter ATP-binding protein [Paenibacillus sp. GD4]MDQ1914449.1 ABC transporter ATP-binding protein [Paenibacillus sp. GD4]